MSLERYHQKRDFTKTPEPRGKVSRKKQRRFYIQKHAASHLHYDFRLELEGVLKSWAIPKGPSLDPTVKRLAIHVEDHPIEYGTFEGIIPQEEYGGGTVMLWDKGEWESLDKNPLQAYKKGHLRFELHAEKLGGRWDLIRFKKEDKSWFLIKYKDSYARENDDITTQKSKSVLSQQSIEEIEKNYQAVWTTKTGLKKNLKKINIDLPSANMPETISPQLATLVDKPPSGEDWLHEIKLDGYRILAFKHGKQVRLMSRNDIDWTSKFQIIMKAVERIPVTKLILDGEIVLFDEQNRSSFQLLQNALDSDDNPPFIYYVFDLLYYDKWDVRSLPLLERKTLLETVLTPQIPHLHFSDYILGHGEDIFAYSCDLGLEGIVSKLATSSYVTKRSKSWLKIKCLKRQEFVIGGFSPPKNSRSCFGSLFLGLYDKKGNFIYSGNVGTGFSEASLREIHEELKKRIITKNPFNSKPPGITTATWVKPELVSEVEFTAWTKEGRLRHPSFKGLRFDKKARDIIKEVEKPVDKINKQKIALKENQNSLNIKLTHPNKILYEEDKISKKELFNYYLDIADFILPFIKKRPLTLVRCPTTYKDCFYQKKLNETSFEALHPIEIANINQGKSENYIYLDDLEGLLSLIQMGVLEIHPWGSRIENLEHPDILVFDLDPAPDILWKHVVEAAFEIKNHLSEFKLESFVKTTGGKGLHIVVPIQPEYEWDKVKNFAQVFVQFLEQVSPENYTSKMSKTQRKGKIFIDYLRNQRGATAIAVYSTRARIHAPVATPLHWDELTDDIMDTYYTIKTITKRLSHLRKDPWHNFWEIKQSLHLDQLE